MSNERSRTAISIVVAGILLLILAIVFFMLSFSSTIFAHEEQRVQDQLMELGAQQAYSVQLFLGEKTSFIKSIADAVGTTGDIYSQSTEDILNAVREDRDVDNLTVANRQGKFKTKDGNLGDCSDREYFIQARNRNSTVSEIVTSSITGKQVFVIASPVYSKIGELMGVLLGTYEQDTLARVLNVQSFMGRGYLFIIDNDGNFVTQLSNANTASTASSHDGIANVNDVMVFTDEYPRDAFLADLRNDKEGYIHYHRTDGSERYASYIPLNVNGWMLMSVTPAEVVKQNAEQMSSLTVDLALKIGGALLAMVVLVSVVMGVMNTRLRVSLKRFSIAATQTAHVVFTYDMKHDVLAFEGDSHMKYGVPAEIHNVDEFIIGAGILSSDDMKLHRQNFARLRTGEPSVDYVVRFHLGELTRVGEVKMTSVSSGKPVPELIVGTIIDITEQRQLEETLRHDAEYDALTGIYNRSTAKGLINAILQQGDARQALLMIDVDNFKSLNDTFGHDIGDRALRMMASDMCTVFRESDIKARLGGDEFIVMMRDVRNEQVAVKKAQKLIDLLPLTSKEILPEYPENCSVGIAFSEPGATFDTLYKQADIALYRAKEAGRRRCVVYKDEK